MKMFMESKGPSVKITQVHIQKGTLEKVAWINHKNGMKTGDKVKMPNDKELWTILKIYKTTMSHKIHDAHLYEPE